MLRLAARGLGNREIADTLVVSVRTVQHHLASVYDKTGRRTRAATGHHDDYGRQQEHDRDVAEVAVHRDKA